MRDDFFEVREALDWNPTAMRVISLHPNAKAALDRIESRLHEAEERADRFTAEWKQALHDRDEIRHERDRLLAFLKEHFDEDEVRAALKRIRR